MGVAKKAGVVLGIGVALYVLAQAVFWFVYPWSGGVSTKLRQLVREGRATTVNLAEVTKFHWTDMYAFGPYQMRDGICPVLGLSGFMCWWIVPGMVDEGHYLLVFRDRREIVHHEHHARYNGDFYAAGQPQPLPRDDATFVVVQNGKTTTGDAWLSLRHKSLRSSLSLNTDARKSTRRSATR